MGIKEKLNKIAGSLAYKQSRLKMSVAAQLAEITAGAGITNTVMAENLACNPSYVTKIFQGDANLSIESLVKIANALGREVEISFVDRSQPKLTHDWEHLAKLRNVQSKSDYVERYEVLRKVA